MYRLSLLLVVLAGIMGSGCGGGNGAAVAPKKFADPPTSEPSLGGGKGTTKQPTASD